MGSASISAWLYRGEGEFNEDKILTFIASMPCQILYITLYVELVLTYFIFRGVHTHPVPGGFYHQRIHQTTRIMVIILMHIPDKM